MKINKGITLISLVITIVILLILAGITINQLTGDKGLFTIAKQAKQNTIDAQKKENVILEDYEKEINKYAGEIKLVADNTNTQLSATDNTKLQDEYGNKITLPARFKIKVDDSTNNATTVDKGIVIEDESGNQFVWIPVGKIYTDSAKTETKAKTITLGRYEFDSTTGEGSTYSGSYVEEDANDTTTLKNYGNTIAKNIANFKTSVSQNGGYYIGRYEARQNTSGNITEIKTDTVWNNITQPNSVTAAQGMYNSAKFTSDLINSYAWDTAIVFIQKCTNQTRYSYQTSLNDSLSTTGTITDVQCNVYDMASNVWEWTTETSDVAGGPCVPRGGVFDDNRYYTSVRYGIVTSNSYDSIGFRPLLYCSTES